MPSRRRERGARRTACDCSASCGATRLARRPARRRRACRRRSVAAIATASTRGVDGDLRHARRSAACAGRRRSTTPAGCPARRRAAVTTRLSTSSCADRAAARFAERRRTARSKPRAVARTSSRFERLAQATSRSRPTAPSSTTSVRRSRVADDVLGERDEAGPPAALAGRQRRRDLARRSRAARDRPPRATRRARAARRRRARGSGGASCGDVGLHRHRDLDVARQRQAGRRHADDGVGLAIEPERPGRRRRAGRRSGGARTRPRGSPPWRRSGRSSSARKSRPLSHAARRASPRKLAVTVRTWISCGLAAAGQVHGPPRDRRHRGEARARVP